MRGPLVSYASIALMVCLLSVAAAGLMLAVLRMGMPDV